MGLGEQATAEYRGDDRVEPARGRHRPQGERGCDGEPAVDDDLPADLVRRGHHRQHRDGGGCVVVAVADREGPEVRRGPEEDDKEEDDRRPGQRAGDSGPADQRRETTGGAAPDDVLRRTSLQDERVPEHVEDVRRQREDRGEPVDRSAEQHGGSHAQREAEHQRRPGRDLVARQWSAPGPEHLLVDVTVDHAVQGVGAPGGEGAADHRREDEPQGRNAALRQEHHRHRGQQQELDDAGLGEGDVRADHVEPSARDREGTGRPMAARGRRSGRQYRSSSVHNRH